MIVIYTLDGTYIRSNVDAAKSLLTLFYGEKLGTEAYETLKNARDCLSYQKNGGPLVQVVTKEKAEEIRKKENSIGMLREYLQY